MIQDILAESIRVLFLVALPITVALVVASTVINFIQTSMSLKDPIILYSVRVVAFIIVVTMSGSFISDAILDFATLAWSAKP